MTMKKEGHHTMLKKFGTHDLLKKFVDRLIYWSLSMRLQHTIDMLLLLPVIYTIHIKPISFMKDL